MRGQKDLGSMKRGSFGLQITVKIDTKCLKRLNNTFLVKIRSSLGQSISGA